MLEQRLPHRILSLCLTYSIRSAMLGNMNICEGDEGKVASNSFSWPGWSSSSTILRLQPNVFAARVGIWSAIGQDVMKHQGVQEVRWVCLHEQRVLEIYWSWVGTCHERNFRSLARQKAEIL